MTARKSDLADLPAWPRCLSKEQAAAYVGVSPNVFTAEVKLGRWPQAEKRGTKGGRLTWDRHALDACLDRRSNLSTASSWSSRGMRDVGKVA